MGNITVILSINIHRCLYFSMKYYWNMTLITTLETPYSIVYNVDVMTPIEV